MGELAGNLLVAQSGGPTAVINASLAGVIEEAQLHDAVAEIYGGRNGILGILNEELVDLRQEPQSTLEGLWQTPGAALGTCRYKIDFAKHPQQAAVDMQRLFDVFAAHNIRFFCYIGGNDSQDTSHKIHDEARRRGWAMSVIGVPKTIDNDIPHTDHCPGYGSVVKYLATTVAEMSRDFGSMATDDGSCCVIEVMGRSAGWIAAGTVLAKRLPSDPPHVILMAEVRYNLEAVCAKVRDVIQTHNYCILVVSEGVRDDSGREIGADPAEKDSFGHTLLSGAAELLAAKIRHSLRVKTRTVKLGYAQRAAAHCASLTDARNALACGAAAVRAAVAGKSGFMVKLVRKSERRWETDLQPLEDVANLERLIPRDWISDDGFLPNERFVEYARPLIGGEIELPFQGGIPRFVALENRLVGQKLPPRE